MLHARMEQLRTLTTIAQQALGYLSPGSQAPAARKQQSLESIGVAEKPSAMITFLFLPDLTKLVYVCSRRSMLLGELGIYAPDVWLRGA